jgi:hypothetical protein
LRILLDGKSTELLRTGLYDFNKNQHLVRVLDGEVLVSGGDKRVKVKSGYLVDITRPTIPSAATVGLAKAGTGILGSTPTHFFPAMASSSALLAGAFIHHGARTLHPSTVATTTVILIPEFKHGVPEPTTASLVTTATVFNMQRIREVHWLVARDRVCSAEVARMAAASMAEEDFMVVVDFTEEQASVGTGRREIVELG